MSRLHKRLRGFAALGAAACLSVLAPMLTALPAQALPPASPQNLTVAQPDQATTILRWDHVAQATRYLVQVDDDANFGSMAVNTQTVSNSYVPLVNLPAASYYWRVQAYSSDPTPSGFSNSTFTTGDIQGPTLVSPADGVTLDQPASPPLLAWQPVPGATSYVVELSPESTFGASTVQKTTQNTSYVWPDPLVADDWFWRVKASKGPGLVSPPSEERKFFVQAIATPRIPVPAQGVVQDVVLDWEPVPGAVSYEVEVGRDIDFNNIVERRSGILGTRYSPPTTYDNANQYFWRVRAYDAAGQATAWTDARADFERSYPQRPEAVHPIGAGVEDVPSPVYFQWTPVQHASEYEIQVGTQENFSTGTYESCRTAGTTYTPGMFAINTTGQPSTMRPNEDCNPQAGVTNYWRVRALDTPFAKVGDIPGVQGLFSDVHAFRLAPLVVTDMTPSGGQVVDVPTLSWSPVVGAEKYEVRILRANGSTADSATTSSTSYTPKGQNQLKPADGPFTWELRAVGADTMKSMLYTRTFNVSGATSTTPEPALTPLTPAQGDTSLVEAPRMTWSPWPGAAFYRVSIGPATDGDPVWFTHGSSDLFDQPVPYPAMTEISTRLLLPGDYDWRVEAYDSNNLLLGQGPEQRFTIQPIRATTGHALALGGRQLDPNNLGTKSPCAPASGTGACTPNGTPVIAWEADPRVSFYMVYVSRDANFTNLIEPSNAIPATTNSMYAPALDNASHTYPDTQGGPAFFWHIRPCRTLFNCATDPVSKVGETQGTFTKTSPQVRGLFTLDPTGEARDNEITLKWEDYWITNQSSDNRWAQTGEQGTQSARQYRVQVTQGATVVDTKVVDQATYTAFEKLYPEGTLSWRVQAIDSDGNNLPWSEPQTIVKATPQVSLTSPVAMATVHGTAAFRWEAQSFATSYELEVYKNDDMTFSAANRIGAASAVGIKTTAFVPTTPLPPSATNYVWRVRRVDPSGNKGPWSAAGKFVVGDGMVETLSPALGATVPPNGPVLQWRQVAGAAKYDVTIRPMSGNGTSVTASTTASAHTAVQALSNGDYEWSITARDSANNIVGTGRSTFLVAGAVTAVQRPMIDTPDGTGVGKTVSGVAPTWNVDLVTTTYQWQRDGMNVGAALTCAPEQPACTPEYTLAPGDLGKNITLKATGRRSAYGDGVTTSDPIIPTTGDAISNVTAPTIGKAPSGGAYTPSVGTSVAAHPGTWAPSTTTFTYQWLRDNAPISGATWQTYTIGKDDLGAQLSVRVTAKLTGYGDGVASSDSVQVIALSATTPPKVLTPEGTGVGATLDSQDPIWNQPPVVTNTYQWLRDGNPIWGQTAPRYQVVTADIGKKISLRVTGAKPEFPAGGTAVSNEVLATAGPAPVPTTLPTIAGTAAPGNSLTASTGAWTLPSGYVQYLYQWLRNGQPIRNATGSSYWLTASDAAQRISVRVTARVNGYEDGRATSTAVAVAKVKSTTTLTVSPNPVKPSARAKAYIQVTAPGVSGPTGTIVIKDGTKTLKTLSLTATKGGRIVFRLPRLKRLGKHRIKVIYKGSPTIAASKSTRVILLVRR